MPQRITPVKVMSVSQDGECHLTITLELNINLTANGEIGASLQAQGDKPALKQTTKDDDEVELTVPDFISGMKLDFGKNVGVK
jgi:hypothetical protein